MMCPVKLPNEMSALSGTVSSVHGLNLAYFLFKQQNSSEKRKLLNFVCSNSTWKDKTLTATFRQPFDLLALTNTTWQSKKAAGNSSSDLCPEWRRGQDSNLHSLSAGG